MLLIFVDALCLNTWGTLKILYEWRCIAIPSFGDGNLIGAGLFCKHDNPISPNGSFFAFPTRFYVD